MFHKIRNFIDESTKYFLECRENVILDNLSLLKKANYCALVVLLLYGCFGAFSFRSSSLTFTYLIFFVLHGMMAFFIRHYNRRKYFSFRMVQRLCMLFVILVMSFILVISIFPFRDRPAIFFSIFIMAIGQIFIFPLWETIAVLTGFEMLFLILSFCMKTLESFSYDWFGSVTAWIISLILAYLVWEIRLREGRIRMALRKTSITDELTGLNNRRSFDEHLKDIFLICAEKREKLAVIMIDIDDFKQFNDTYGHPAGDECLRMIGSFIRDYATEEGIFAARYGGEEIALIVSGQKAEKAVKYANEIAEAISRFSFHSEEKESIRITISLGMAVKIPENGQDHLNILKEADLALYRAKKSGKNRISIYSEKKIDT